MLFAVGSVNVPPDPFESALVNHPADSGSNGTYPKRKQATSVELAIEIRVKPPKFQELYQTLQALLPTIRKEKGCRDCRIYRDVEDGEIFLLSVRWDSQASLDSYVRSSSGIALLGAIDLLSEKAAVKIGHGVPWEGIDTLKRMRKKPCHGLIARRDPG